MTSTIRGIQSLFTSHSASRQRLMYPIDTNNDMGMAAGNGDDTHFMGTKFIRLAFLWKGNE
jgi:hypothetical protein